MSVFRTEEGASESSGEIVRLVSVITSALIGSSGCVTNAIASWVMEEGLEIRRPCSRLRASSKDGARGGSRTPTPLRAPDPKSGASAVPPLSRWLKL